MVSSLVRPSYVPGLVFESLLMPIQKLTILAIVGISHALAYVPTLPEVTYVVQDADIVSGHPACSIASNCGVDISHLVLYNPDIASWRSLQSGTILRLPSTAHCRPTSNLPTSTTPLISIMETDLKKRQSSETYTVVSGDTAWKISEANHVSLDSLKAANPQVSNWELIYPGMVLNIPSEKASVQSSTSAAPPNQPSTDPSTSLCVPGKTYTIVSGDTAYDVAQRYGITLDQLKAANCQVCDWELIHPGLQLIIPYGSSKPSSPPPGEHPSPPPGIPPGPPGPPSGPSTTSCPFSSPSTPPRPPGPPEPPGPPPPPSSPSQVIEQFAIKNFNVDDGSAKAQNQYSFYQGDGSQAGGWPAHDQWISFNALWDSVLPYIGKECVGSGATPNTDEENQQVREAILTISAQAQIDPRFVLAVAMQESTGCVRVQSTANAVSNPGIMQSYMGKGTCNSGGTVQSPCPESQIQLMIQEGVSGGEVNLVAGLNRANSIANLGKAELAQAYYRSARMYNSGPNSFSLGADLGQVGATECYVCDIANRLMGWTTDTRKCTLGQ